MIQSVPETIIFIIKYFGGKYCLGDGQNDFNRNEIVNETVNGEILFKRLVVVDKGSAYFRKIYEDLLDILNWTIFRLQGMSNVKDWYFNLFLCTT